MAHQTLPTLAEQYAAEGLDEDGYLPAIDPEVELAALRNVLATLMSRGQHPQVHPRCENDGDYGHLGACFAIHGRTADTLDVTEQACVPCVAFYALTHQDVPLDPTRYDYQERS